jgi:glycosyltransferase involved in cell wall biosynthesis
MLVYLLCLGIASRIGPKQRTAGPDGAEILLTGTFYSDQWLATHLVPLAGSARCRRVRMVASTPVPGIDKVQAVYPPRWLVKIVGGVPARMVTFVWLGIWTRPHVIGGFHLLVNGLAAVLIAKLIGARSLYICGGGPREVSGGGYATENRLFNRLGAPDPLIERCLLRAVAAFDLVITMGSRAVEYFRERKVDTTFHIIPGGFNGEEFSPGPEEPTTDLVLIGRLSSVKRVDLFLETIGLLRASIPSMSATVVGDGPIRGELEQFSAKLGLERQVAFVGYRSDVHRWLRRARVFVLTSDSEGLSQAMIQAMLCGRPVVVSNVGDLSDVVEDGVNGYLVAERTPEAFALRIRPLLTDPEQWRRCSHEARRTAERFEMGRVSRTWDAILASGPVPSHDSLKDRESRWSAPRGA